MESELQSKRPRPAQAAGAPAFRADLSEARSRVRSGVLKKNRTAPRRLPREHGFWVMLSVALCSGVALSPTWQGLLAALGAGVGAVLGAVFVGKRIRKNSALQVIAALMMGALSGLIGRAGGASFGQTFELVFPLSVAFVSTTISVQALLLRARKRLQIANLFAALSLIVPVGGTVGCWVWLDHHATSSATIVLMASLGLALSRPSARRLKAVGMMVAATQLTVAILVLW